MSARRHRPEHVLPLELWDVMVHDQPLYQIEAGEQPAAIADAVAQLRAGCARRLRADLPLPQLPIDQVVLAGGRALTPTLAALHQLPLAACAARDPLWIGEAGGRALLEAQLGSCRLGVLDVGQTALKYTGPAGRAHHARDFDQVPLELDARDPAAQPGFRANSVQFIAAALRAQPRPDALVLALPCEIADDLTVAGCSYPWLAGDPLLVHDVLDAAEMRDVTCLVLNDAELAAVGVGAKRRTGGVTLVLTLGLGVGAAALI